MNKTVRFAITGLALACVGVASILVVVVHSRRARQHRKEISP